MKSHNRAIAISLFASKKGESETTEIGEKMGFFALVIIITGFSTVGYALTTTHYLFRNTHVPVSLREELLTSRFFSQPECFAFQDPATSRVYPFHVPLSRFTDEQFSNCLPLREGRIDACYEIRLNRMTDHPDTAVAEFRVKTIYSANYQPACAEGADVTIMERPVIIYDEDVRDEGGDGRDQELQGVSGQELSDSLRGSPGEEQYRQYSGVARIITYRRVPA